MYVYMPAVVILSHISVLCTCYKGKGDCGYIPSFQPPTRKMTSRLLIIRTTLNLYQSLKLICSVKMPQNAIFSQLKFSFLLFERPRSPYIWGELQKLQRHTPPFKILYQPTLHPMFYIYWFLYSVCLYLGECFLPPIGKCCHQQVNVATNR